jgi:hypothetical protein
VFPLVAAKGMVRPCSCPISKYAGNGREDQEHAMRIGGRLD